MTKAVSSSTHTAGKKAGRQAGRQAHDALASLRLTRKHPPGRPCRSFMFVHVIFTQRGSGDIHHRANKAGGDLLSSSSTSFFSLLSFRSFHETTWGRQTGKKITSQGGCLGDYRWDFYFPREKRRERRLLRYNLQVCVCARQVLHNETSSIDQKGLKGLFSFRKLKLLFFFFFLLVKYYS